MVAALIFGPLCGLSSTVLGPAGWVARALGYEFVLVQRCHNCLLAARKGCDPSGVGGTSKLVLGQGQFHNKFPNGCPAELVVFTHGSVHDLG